MKNYLLIASAIIGLGSMVGCSDLDDYDSDTSSSSTTSTSGSVLSYGNYTHSYTCPASGAQSVAIPPTSSSFCAGVYEDLADQVGCNIIDNYTSIINNYQSCLNDDVAACAAADPSDPNC